MIDYAIIHLSLRAELSSDGGGFLSIDDVVSFSSVFAVNTIPTATLAIAVGSLASSLGNNPIGASSGNIPSAISKNLKVKVFLKASLSPGVAAQGGGGGNALTQNDIGFRADGTDILIFEGRVLATGRGSSTAGTATAVLQLEHWLANLNYASALSSSSHPGNPGDMTFSAISKTRGTTVSGSGQNSRTVSWVPAVSQEVVNAASLSDLWGQVFYKWMRAVVMDDPFVVTAAGGGLTTSGDTAEILAAINRIIPNNPEGVPLAVDLTGGQDASIIASGIREALLEHTENNWFNTTLWGKLVAEWSSDFWFMVVPRVTDALVVPLTGPVAGTPWATIGNEDYTFANISTSRPHRLRGVGIVQPTQAASGLNLTGGYIAIDYSGFAGLYISPAVSTGVLIVKTAPRWLTSPVAASSVSGVAEGVNDVVQTAIDGPLLAPGQGLTAANIQQAVSASRTLLDKYAQQWFAFEKLKGSGGEVAGKLRLDICPGSNVVVEEDRSVDDVAATAVQRTYATVSQVNIVIDAETQKAHTSFVLTNAHRTADHFGAENSDTVVDKPPLYTQAWRGASLISNQTPERT